MKVDLGIKLGYIEAANQTSGLWGLIRNNLAHRFAPGWGASAAAVGVGWLESSPNLETDRSWFSKFNLPVFDFHDNGTVYVTGDFLVLAYLPKIAEWLCSLIENCSDLESLQLAAQNNLVSLE